MTHSRARNVHMHAHSQTSTQSTVPYSSSCVACVSPFLCGMTLPPVICSQAAVQLRLLYAPSDYAQAADIIEPVCASSSRCLMYIGCSKVGLQSRQRAQAHTASSGDEPVEATRLVPHKGIPKSAQAMDGYNVSLTEVPSQPC